MKIPPGYQITSRILEMIAKINADRMYLSSIPIHPEVKSKIQRHSLLKSALFSARIEGNSLTLENVEITDDRQKKTEVFNILSAISQLDLDKSKNMILQKGD